MSASDLPESRRSQKASPSVQELAPSYKIPFDLIAQKITAYLKEKAVLSVQDGFSRVWLPESDATRIQKALIYNDPARYQGPVLEDSFGL